MKDRYKNLYNSKRKILECFYKILASISLYSEQPSRICKMNPEFDYVPFASHNGTYKIAHAGYVYTKRCSKINCKGVYYYCKERSICNASIVYKNGVWSPGRSSAYSSDGTHRNHLPNRDKVTAEILIGKAKELLRDDPQLTAREVMNRTVSDAPVDAQKFIPKKDLLTRNINRHRKSMKCFKNPVILPDLTEPSKSA